jgi:hypothetical protein
MLIAGPFRRLVIYAPQRLGGWALRRTHGSGNLKPGAPSGFNSFSDNELVTPWWLDGDRQGFWKQAEPSFDSQRGAPISFNGIMCMLFAT